MTMNSLNSPRTSSAPGSAAQDKPLALETVLSTLVALRQIAAALVAGN